MSGEKKIISVDVMGGSNAPFSAIEGMKNFLETQEGKNVYFRIFGRKKEIHDIVKSNNTLANSSEIIDCQDIVRDDDEPVKAMRNGKKTSMFLAITDVKEGKSHACVSAGNTGALMVMSLMILKSIEGIKRPAITNVFPNPKGGAVMLDFGANSECDPINFYQFAIMGHAYANAVMGKKSPTVGILNMGTEKNKGRTLEKESFKLLEGSGLNFIGNVEGYDVTKGNVDVVVTDGFSGNLVLKTAEGMGDLCKDIIKESFSQNIFSKIGGMLAAKSLKKVMKRVDPRYYNGAMFMGLNGVVVKSHGSSDTIAFENALKRTYSLVKNNVNEQIIELLADSANKDAQKSIMSKIKTKLGF